MDRAPNTLTITLTRTIAASPEEAFEAWLSPAVPGTPWNAASKLILDAKVDGMFYSRMNDTPHYGRFIRLEHGREVQHTWMSPYTDGYESLVVVTFTKKGHDTEMRLEHSGLPESDRGRLHEKGWTFFMDSFPAQFAAQAKVQHG
jgi:uncharacterized protein YndB with AHSA1/START domain